MTALTDLPHFHSLALDEIPAPDFADVQIVPIPPELIMEPQDWAARLFDFRSAPAWVAGAMAVQAVRGRPDRDSSRAITAHSPCSGWWVRRP